MSDHVVNLRAPAGLCYPSSSGVSRLRLAGGLGWFFAGSGASGVAFVRRVSRPAQRPPIRPAIEFPAENSAPLVLKASVRPSCVVSLVETAQQVDPQVSIVAHAQSGVVLLRYDSFPSEGISRAVVGKLQSEVATGGGSLVVLSNPSQSEMTPRSVFGVPHDVLTISTAIKRQFDPRDILNRGRFIFRSET